MMTPPAALPLHLMLTMMQSGVYPGASMGLNAPWNAYLPSWMRPKTPLEKGFDALQSLNQQLSEAGTEWLKPPQSKHQTKGSSSERHSREGRNPRAKTFSATDAASAWIPAFAGMTTDSASPLTDYLPHFMQPEFLTALSEKAYANSAGFMAGMQAYLSSDYTRVQPEYDILWEHGSARLLDLAPEFVDNVAVLMIPSLINQSYVLDLYPDASLAQYLKSQGFRPLILDWGAPGEDELDFSTADYINAYALPALQALREAHDAPITLLGYCMGGVFATAMAQLAPLYVDALILLATPWDFSSEDTSTVFLQPATQTMLRQWIRTQNPVQPIITQSVFHLIDPWRIQEKYSRYPSLNDAEKQHFLAVEQWVNDGVPLAQKVAEECFVDWPQGNILANHQWKVGRRWIEPGSITCPTLAVIPTRDKIVPTGCAMPLAAEIPRCDVLQPESGHIGMVVGRNAKAALWKPLAHWLKSKF